MTNFETAVRANEMALDAQGSALQENARYMEGIEAKTQAVAASFERLATQVIESELIKALLDLANGAFNLLNNEVGITLTQWGLLTGVLIGAITIFGTIATKITVMMAAITAAGGAMATMASIAAPLAAILSAIGVLAIKSYSNWKKLHPSLEEINSDIKGMTNQLEDNKTRLDELNKIGWADRTYEIQLEIDKLKAENAELEENLKLQKQKAFEETKKKAEGSIAIRQRELIAYGGETDFDTGQYIEIEGLGAPSQREALVNLNTVLATLGRTVETVYYKTGDFIDATKEAEDAYVFLKRALSNAIEEFKWSGQVSDETRRVIGENADTIKELISWYEILGEDAPKDLVSVVNAFDKYTKVINDARKAHQELETETQIDVVSLYQMSEATDETRESIVKLIAQENIFNNTKLSVQDKIQQFKNLALAAGASANAVNAAVKAALGYVFTPDALGFTDKSGRPLSWIEQGGALSAFSAHLEDVDTNAIEGIFNKLIEDEFHYTSTGGGGGKDAIKEAFEAAYKLAQHNREMNLADEKNYLDTVEYLNNKYFANKKQYQEDYWKYEEEVYKGRQKLAEEATKAAEELARQEAESKKAAIEKEFSDLEHALAMQTITEEQYYTTLSDLADKYYKDNAEYAREYERIQERLFEYNAQKAVKWLDEQNEKFKEQLEIFDDFEKRINDFYDKEKERLEGNNKELEKRIEYEKLLDNLAKAREQRKLVYKEGRFQYVSDTEAIATAQLALDEYNRKQQLERQLSATEANRASSSQATTQAKDSRILAQMAKNSALWHKAETNEEREELHRQNVELASQLSENARRRYDNETGLWSAYANGAINAQGGLSLVGENGAELRVLNKGDGILSTEITKNLLAWGAVSPYQAIGNLVSGAQGGSSINIGNVNLPSVTNAQEFVTALKNIAYQYAYQRA